MDEDENVFQMSEEDDGRLRERKIKSGDGFEGETSRFQFRRGKAGDQVTREVGEEGWGGICVGAGQF